MDEPRPCNEEFTVGWICALAVERWAAEQILDITYKGASGNHVLGRVGKHNVVIGWLPSRRYGTISAANLVNQMQSDFKNIQIRLLVGIGGGVPGGDADVRLGDVVVSAPHRTHAGVVQHDLGKIGRRGAVERTGCLNGPPDNLLEVVLNLESQVEFGGSRVWEHLGVFQGRFSLEMAGDDVLFPPELLHIPGTGCELCGLENAIKRDPRPVQLPIIHYGTIASGDQVIKDGVTRDSKSLEIGGVLCFDMEAAGIMNRYPGLVIRGICDYSDSHKNKSWQPYAAATAAACAKEILLLCPPAQPTSIESRANTERYNAPPTPSLAIPFPNGPDFIDREALLCQIYKKCARPGSGTALVGLGGVGKSRLAMEYAYRCREQFPNTWVFWVDGSGPAQFVQSYRDIASLLQLNGRNDHHESLFKHVNGWLRNESNGRWLIILDNVNEALFSLGTQLDEQDTPGRSEEEATQILRGYLPRAWNGTTLMTTRSREIALRLVERLKVISIQPMDEAEALSLLHSSTRRQVDSEDSKHLIAVLNFLPLAIIEAAVHLNRTLPRYSVQQYINELYRSDCHVANSPDSSRPFHKQPTIQNSILETWKPSFDHIRRVRSTAASLLSLMSFCDSRSIPVVLFRTQQQHDNEDLGRDDNFPPIEADVLEKDALMLQDYSFISISEDLLSFEMNELVQLAIRKWLADDKQLEELMQRHLINLENELPPKSYGRWWEKWDLLFPHIQSIFSRRPEGKESLIRWSSVLDKGAWHAWCQGKVRCAMEMAVEAMNVRLELLEPEHPDTLESMVMVGLGHGITELWAQMTTSEKLIRPVCSAFLPKEYNVRLWLSDCPDLTWTYQNQKWRAGAEGLLTRLVEIQKREFGAENFRTITSMAHLASTYFNLGRLTEAEALQKQIQELLAVTSCSKFSEGPEDMAYLAAYRASHENAASLALTYAAQNKWAEAQKLEEQLVDLFKETKGLDGPSTVVGSINLAVTFMNQTRWDEAAKLLEPHADLKRLEALPHYGLEALPQWTPVAMMNLAVVRQNQGRLTKAEELGIRAMELSRIVRGPDSACALSSMMILSRIWKLQGRYKEALQVMDEYVQVCSRLAGPDHPFALQANEKLKSLQAEAHDALMGPDADDFS